MSAYQPVHPASVRHIPLEERGDHANWRVCDCPACEFVRTLHASVRPKVFEQTEPYGTKFRHLTLLGPTT